MPSLVHIHKASAGPPTFSIQGLKLSAVERQSRYRENPGQRFTENVHVNTCSFQMSPEAVFGPPNVSTSEEVERLKQENLQLLNTNVMLKEEIVSLTKENTFLAQECRVATEKFNLLQTLVVGGNLVCPQNSVQTPAHCQAVHGGNALQPTIFSPGASQVAQGGAFTAYKNVHSCSKPICPRRECTSDKHL